LIIHGFTVHHVFLYFYPSPPAHKIFLGIHKNQQQNNNQKHRRTRSNNSKHKRDTNILQALSEEAVTLFFRKTGCFQHTAVIRLQISADLNEVAFGGVFDSNVPLETLRNIFAYRSWSLPYPRP